MKRSYLKYFAGLLVFGSNGVISSFIHLNSYEIVLFRSVLGSLFLLGLFFAAGHPVSILQHKHDFFFVALSGVAMAVDWLLLFEAYAEIGVCLGVLINYTGPVLVIALSPLILKERITGSNVIALVAALSGAFLISGQAVADGISAWGLFCAALSAVAYAVMVLSNKLAKEIDGTENAVVQLLCTALTVAAFVGWKQGFSIDLAPGDWLPILQLGLLNTAIGCWCYFSSIGDLPAQSVAVCGYLEPLFAVILSVLILQESMSLLQVIGALLIIGGAIYGECHKKPRIQETHGKSVSGL